MKRLSDSMKKKRLFERNLISKPIINLILTISFLVFGAFVVFFNGRRRTFYLYLKSNCNSFLYSNGHYTSSNLVETLFVNK